MKGDRLSKRKGRGSEFADFRPYTVGDDLRFLDWNLFGRLDKLFLRMFLEEEDLSVHLLIDNSGSMDYGTPSEAAVRQAGGGGPRVRRPHQPGPRERGDHRRGAGRAESGVPRAAEPAADDEVHRRTSRPAGGGDLNRSLRNFSLRATGRGVAIVLSDFMDKDGFEEGLRFLAARNLDVYAHPHSEPGGDRARRSPAT